VDQDDVSDNKVPDADGLGGTLSAPDDGDIFVLNHGLQGHKFSILDVVGRRRDEEHQDRHDNNANALGKSMPPE